MTFLQICPNDHPPFLDLCRHYQAAGKSLGLPVHTVFLAPATIVPAQGFAYLNGKNLGRTRQLGRILRSHVTETLGREPPVLAICHRYRAHVVFRASRLKAKTTVTIAHEFGFFKRARRRLARRLFDRGGHFAGVSEPLRNELAREVKDALLLPNGIDWAAQASGRVPRRKAREKLGLGQTGFYVGVVGRLHPKKQPELALDGFRGASAVMPDAGLVFIGDGELRSTLASRASALPIVFTGFVPEAWRYFNALDLLLIPAGNQEAFGLVALEAMAAGVAVVVGPSPGPRSVVGDAACHYDAPTEEAIATALGRAYRDHRAGKLQAQVERGIHRVKQEFSIAATAGRLHDLLQSSRDA